MGKRVTEAQFNRVKTSLNLSGYVPIIAKTNELAQTTVEKIKQYETYTDYKDYLKKKHGYQGNLGDILKVAHGLSGDYEIQSVKVNKEGRILNIEIKINLK